LKFDAAIATFNSISKWKWWAIIDNGIQAKFHSSIGCWLLTQI